MMPWLCEPSSVFQTHSYAPTTPGAPRKSSTRTCAQHSRVHVLAELAPTNRSPRGPDVQAIDRHRAHMVSGISSFATTCPNYGVHRRTSDVLSPFTFIFGRNSGTPAHANLKNTSAAPGFLGLPTNELKAGSFVIGVFAYKSFFR
jgi:hypothetical protein